MKYIVGKFYDFNQENLKTSKEGMMQAQILPKEWCFSTGSREKNTYQTKLRGWSGGENKTQIK